MTGVTMQGHEKTQEEKSEELVLLLRTVVDKHLQDKDFVKNFRTALGANQRFDFGGSEKHNKRLDAFRVELEKANAKYKGINLVFNPKDKDYKEKKIVFETIPAILKTLKDKGVDEALSATKALIAFYKDQELVASKSSKTWGRKK